MRLYIIRHADPDYPNNTITEGGHKEAQALAKRMKQQGLDKIYTSPLGRAVDTMRYTADALQMDYNIEHWTQELEQLMLQHLPYDYKAAWDVPGETIRTENGLPNHQNWHELSYYQNTPVVEVFEEIKKHSDEFLARHGFVREGGRYRITKPNNREKIAVFCHGGFGLTWLAHLLEIPLTLMWSGFWLPPSSVTTILFDERSDEWATPRCIGLGDVSHLYEAGLPVRPRGVKANFD